MIFRSLLCATLSIGAATTSVHAQNVAPSIDGANCYRMIDLDYYDPQKEWSYIPKSSTVIGIPFTSGPVEVCYDGSIFTGDSELSFFYGKNAKRLEAYQKTFKEGWIPVVEYNWSDDGIEYFIEMFGVQLDGENTENSLQMVRVTMTNKTNDAQDAYFQVGNRTRGNDHRTHGAHFSDDFLYEFKNDGLYRNRKLVYTFEGEPQMYATENEVYSEPFLAKEKQVKSNTYVGLVQYNPTLKSGESVTLSFKMPRVAQDWTSSYSNKVRQADVDTYYNKCVNYWEQLFSEHGHFSIPEQRVDNSARAAMVHLMLASRYKDGEFRQGSGLPYDQLFFNDYIDMRLAYDVMGLHEFIDVNTPWLERNISPEGMFIDNSLSHGQIILASHGQALFTMCNHLMFSRDIAQAKKLMPTIAKAVGFIQNDHNSQPNGLLRPSIPYDNEMIKGHYTSHNLWGILAVRNAVRVAQMVGDSEKVEQWTNLESSYRSAILRAIDASITQEGYVPTGLYDFITGPDSREGFNEFRTNQAWENMLLLYPSELLELDDPRVKSTLAYLRKHKFREGTMTYREGMHIHQYITTNVTNQSLALNQSQKAITDLYSILLHNGSTHEGFENMIEPWGDRDPNGCPPPHGWAAAKTALLIRNMLVREYGGLAGMNMEDRGLYLYSAISPSWAKDGDTIGIYKSKTEFGEINSEMIFDGDRATITLDGDFHTQPSFIKIAVPYFKKFISATSDKGRVLVRDGYMEIPQGATTVDVQWRNNKNYVQKNIQRMLETYRREPGYKWLGTENLKYEHAHPAAIMGNTAYEVVAIEPEPKGFLLPEEKSIESTVFSFEDVKRAYLLEYERRQGDYLRTGRELMKIEILD